MGMSTDAGRSQRGLSAAEETTPLLGLPESGPVSREDDGKAVPPFANGHSSTKCTTDDVISPASHANQDEEEEKPMPYRQILLLCYASLAEPIAYFAIFPFMPEMIFRMGDIDQSDVGFWAGMIESLFSLVQMVLMIFYGRAADRFGRKPILIFSLAGISVFTALFGMSQTLWQMILTRCMAGVFAGSVVTIRTMISENCTKKSQARAFSWYMFTRNLGIFIGPLIGGSLANPAEQFPGTLGQIQFFHQYPYALATFVAGIVCLSSTLTSLFGLKETLQRKGDGGSDAKPEMSTWDVLKSPGVPTVLYIFGHTMLLGLAYTAVSPVFLYTDINLGGLNFSDQWIAIFIAVAGASQSLWMLLAFPALQRRFGTGTVLRGAAIVWPLLMASFPVLNEFLRHGWTVAFWTIGPASLILGSGVSMAFACVQLCLNDISPSSSVLATVNALALTVNSGVRAFAPIAFTSLFAAGVKIGWADGHLVWFLLVAIALALNVAVYFLPAQAEGRPQKSDAQVAGGDNSTA